MKRVVLFLFAVYCFTFSYAQDNFYKISGKVLDESGQALVGAHVFLKDKKSGASTNEQGLFMLKNVPSGKYILRVQFVGYASLEKSISVEGKDLELTMELKQSSILGENVIIRAVRASEKTPVAYTNMTRDEIEGIHVAQDIPYLLEITPSVVATSEAGTGIGYTGLRIRGTDASRINVTVNGIPLNDSESQGVFWVNMPDFAASVKDIQIQRGVGTSTNGAGAFGATINFQTLSAERFPYAELNTSYGSFNTFKRSVQTGTGLIQDRFAFDLRYSKLTSDGFIKRSFVDHESVFLSGGYYGENTILKANVILGEEHTGISWWGVPEEMLEIDRSFNPAGEYTNDNGETKFYDNQTDNYWQNHYQLMFSHSFSNAFQLNAAGHLTTGEGYYEQYKAGDSFEEYGLNPIQSGDTLISIGQQGYIFQDSTVSESDIIRQKWLDNVFYGLTASAVYTNSNVDLIVGGAWNRYLGDHFGLIKWMKFNAGVPLNYEWYRNTGVKTDWNVYAKLNYNIGSSIVLYADLQYRRINYTMEGPDDDLILIDQKHEFDFFNPKAGVLYRLNDCSKLYASFGIAHREPTRADYKDAVKDGEAMFPVPEKLMDYELGFQMQKKTYAFGLNFYFMDYENQLVNTGELNSVGYPVMTNVKDSYRTGIELHGGLSILNLLNRLPGKYLELLKIEANLTLSRNKILDYIEYAEHYDEDWNAEYLPKALGTTDISYSPDAIAALVIRYQPFKRLEFSSTSKFVGKQYFDNTSSEERMLAPYQYTNLRLSYSFKTKGLELLQASFMINNVTNHLYSNNAYGGNWYEQGV